MNDGLAQLQSQIPSPASTYGYVIERTPSKEVVYDGRLLPRFLSDNGGNPNGYRAFLLENRIGDPFSLQPGRRVVVASHQAGMSRHPEA